jgi:selenide,water dikinase
VLRFLPAITDPNVLVGTSTRDDAAVYRLTESVALVSTIDYFTPIVDDAYAFGAIAAANALSDVYAMGARPLFALNVVGFPRETLPFSILGDILRGGSDKAAEAGIFVVGGHSIDDAEPKYGLAVTGVVHPDRIVRNVGAQPGDAIFLTKPIGTGVVSTAIKRGLATPEAVAEAVATMATLNRSAAEAMLEVGVHAATDVTGYGLLGHLSEMTSGSGVGARIEASAIPLLASAEDLARRDVIPGGTHRNQAAVAEFVEWNSRVDPVTRVLLCDAQTSGGLLIAVARERALDLAAALRAHGTPVAAHVGDIVAGSKLEVVP